MEGSLTFLNYQSVSEGLVGGFIDVVSEGLTLMEKGSACVAGVSVVLIM